MKVALISNSAKGEYTGRFRWCYGLNKLGYEVIFILPRSEKEYIDKIKNSGIRVIEWRLTRRRYNIFNKFISLFQLIKIFMEEDFTIIQSFSHEPNILTALAGKLTSQKNIINTITGMGSAFVEEKILGKIILKIYKILEKNISIFIFENSDDENYFTFVEDSKKKVIYGAGVDTKEFSRENVSEEDIVKLRRSLNISNNDVVVTFIGRLLKSKGILELIEAWKSLNLKHSHLLIVGDVDEYNPNSLTMHEVNKLNGKCNIKFLGRRHDIVPLLALTDIFVNPSYYREGIPRVNIEAMAMGKPIITTDATGCKDTVLNGINGFIVPVKNSSALAEAIYKLTKDRDLREEMGYNSRIIALRKFSLEYVVNEIAGIYKFLISKM